MYSREPNSIVETSYEETYASQSRTDDYIRCSLSTLINDLSMTELYIDGPEDLFWTEQ